MVKMGGTTRYTHAGRGKPKVTEIRYIPTPDARERFSRAIDILLRAATRNREENIRGKKSSSGGDMTATDDKSKGRGYFPKPT
jgi:two-component SAPR family response regulator